MAGAITHLLVAEESAVRIAGENKNLGRVLNNNLPFLLLGSVAPDLPYLDLGSNDQKSFADWMHYEKTNMVPIRMLAKLGNSEYSRRPEGWAQFAFILGYIAHCATDATIHPIVQKAVGVYSLHSLDHRRCEMVQDSLLYERVKGYDLSGSGYAKVLKACGPEEVLQSLFGLWAETLKTVHFGLGIDPHPADWFGFYRRLLDAATDWTVATHFSRALSGKEGYSYLEKEEIKELLPHKKVFWFDDIKMPYPKGATGPFYENGYQRALVNVSKAWVAANSDYRNAKSISKNDEDGELSSFLKNWDLDTGADMMELDTRVTFWQPTVLDESQS